MTSTSTWYLTEEQITFSLFNESLPEEIKSALAAKIGQLDSGKMEIRKPTLPALTSTRHGFRGVWRGVITPPEFSKNKIEKSILACFLWGGGGGEYLFLTILCPLWIYELRLDDTNFLFLFIVWCPTLFVLCIWFTVQWGCAIYVIPNYSPVQCPWCQFMFECFSLMQGGGIGY